MAPRKLTGRQSHRADDVQRRQLRLCFFIVLILWTLAAIAAPVVAFCFTKSPLSFSFFSTLMPPIYLWYRVAKYVLMDEKTIELENMRFQAKTQNNKISEGEG